MRKKKIFLVAMIAVLLCIFTLRLPVFADVGDFETYSYDSDSSWDSSDSYTYSSHDYSSSSSSGSGSPVVGLIIIGVIIVIIVLAARSNKNGDGGQGTVTTTNRVVDRSTDVYKNQDEIVDKVKAIDPDFSSEVFKSWAGDLFVKLQHAWTERDWSVIRCFESNELFEQHNAQLEKYKENKQINVLEKVSVNWVKFLNFEQSGDKDVLTVVLNSNMIDYIVSEGDRRLIKGDRNIVNVNSYKMVFIRKTGVKTKAGQSTVNTTNCPNCGAPTKITSSGKCEYCGSIVTTGEYDWVLSSLSRYNG